MLKEGAPSDGDQERDQWMDQLLTRPATDANTQLSHVQFFFNKYEEELDEDQVTAIKDEMLRCLRKLDKDPDEMVRCLREKEQSRTNAIHDDTAIFFLLNQVLVFCLIHELPSFSFTFFQKQKGVSEIKIGLMCSRRALDLIYPWILFSSALWP